MPLQLRSQGELVGRWQQVMVDRFAGYAKAADGGPLRGDRYFGADDAAVQREYERRTGQPQDGVVSDEDMRGLGILPTLFTVHGTGVSMWDGPPADTARACLDLCTWQPTGNYPARPFPMWGSILQGVAELQFQISRFRGPIWLAGYSQGAVVVGLVWKYDILAPSGKLHHRLKDVKKVVTWGDPMREVGHLTHDGVGQPARTTSAGILEDRLVDTPPFWRSYAHAGDLYTDCELDDEGEYKRAIGKIVMGSNVFGGGDSIVAQILELGMRPLEEGIAVAKAITDAGMFFAKRTAPHTNYNVRPAIDYLRAA